MASPSEEDHQEGSGLEKVRGGITKSRTQSGEDAGIGSEQGQSSALPHALMFAPAFKNARIAHFSNGKCSSQVRFPLHCYKYNVLFIGLGSQLA